MPAHRAAAPIAMGKKKSAGASNVLADVPADLLPPILDDDGHEIDVCAESFSALSQRHSRELARMEAHVGTFGATKPAKDRAMRALGVVSDRHYAELEAWKEANESESESESEEDADAVARALDAASLRESTSDADDDANTNAPTSNVPKISKAMARKAKRAAEEAAREERIAAEKAALGPSAEALESDILRARLAPLGLKVKDIKADGHCLYRAIDDQLMATGCGPYEGGFQGLREACARTMREDAWAYRPFVDDCAGNDDDADAKWDKYVSDVANTATWGGQVELMALAKVIERPIEVFSATMPKVTMGEDFVGRGPAARVAYHRHAFGLGEHYNSVEDV